MGLSNSHKMLEAKTVEDFDKILKEAGSDLVVVHFWAAWAPMCQQMSDVMEILAKDSSYQPAKFVKVEAEALAVVSQRYEIAAVPTCILLRNGSIVDRVDGANAPELTEKVRKQSKVQPLPAKPKPAPAEDLESRLKKLINAAPVMLFMKGSPEEPRCGFSRTTIGILQDQQAQFKTFDILSDEEVRQGLKKFSDWPTYPQLYINGELIGGLDIIKEMVESGEFKDMLPKQESLDDRLKRLINQQTVMLFMKGNPEQPRCGFSKTTVGILAETGVEYGTFDILGDEEVRQGLKKFSDWPTYPQLYVKGELVGGLDIIKELKESGDLESTLKGD